MSFERESRGRRVAGELARTGFVLTAGAALLYVVENFWSKADVSSLFSIPFTNFHADWLPLAVYGGSGALRVVNALVSNPTGNKNGYAMRDKTIGYAEDAAFGGVVFGIPGAIGYPLATAGYRGFKRWLAA